MVSEALIADIISMGIRDEKVIGSMRKTLRQLFVRQDDLGSAFANYPLPIGYGQTISQPYTVAYMAELLRLKKCDRVLEVGAGSGYSAAVIANIVRPGIVYTIELIRELADFAQSNLARAGIRNVKVIHGDGSKGYLKHAPYDAVIVTAACPSIPRPLIEQLKVGGRLVAPVDSYIGQVMVRLTKEKGDIKKEEFGSFSFVPLRS